jgi:hypothetical protein
MPDALDRIFWTRIDGDRPSLAPLPRLTLLEAQWRVLTLHGRIVSCGIYQSASRGLEVAVVHDGLLICRQHAWTIESARALGREWLDELRAQGVEELTVSSADANAKLPQTYND